MTTGFLDTVPCANLRRTIDSLTRRDFVSSVWIALYAVGVLLFASKWLNVDSALLATARDWLWVVILVLLAVMIFLLCGYTVSQLACIGVILVVFAVSARVSAEPRLFRLIVFVFAARGVEFDRIAKTLCISCVAALVLAFVLLAAGVATNVIIPRHEEVGGGVVRQSLGFGGVNNLATIILMVVIGALLSFYRTYRWRVVVVAIALIGASFLVTNYKTGLICGPLAIVAVIIADRLMANAADRTKWCVIIIALVVLIAVGYVALFSAYSIDNPVLRKINVLLSDRLNLSKWGIETYGIPAFGQSTKFELPIDCLFAYAPVRYGLIPSVIFFGMNLLAVYRSARAGRFDIALMTVVLVVYSTMEKVTIAHAINITLFALTASLEAPRTRTSSARHAASTLSRRAADPPISPTAGAVQPCASFPAAHIGESDLVGKRLHCIWLSDNPMDELAQACIASWKRAMPDYEIKVWRTDDFDMSRMPVFVKEGIEQEKWAFACDYLRLLVVYEQGGIYLDSDVFMLDRFDRFLNKRYFSFIEHHEPAFSQNKALVDEQGRALTQQHVPGLGIQAACFGAAAGHPFLKDCMEYYEQHHYADATGKAVSDMVAPDVYALRARAYGFRYADEEQHLAEGMMLYPSSLLAGCMREYDEGEPSVLGVHLCAGSWRDNSAVRQLLLNKALNASLRRLERRG